MLTLTCDRCDKPFEVDDASAGTKVACPYCKDINIVPRMGRPVDAGVGEGGGAGGGAVGGMGGGEAEDRAAKLGLPPARGPEVEVMRVRASMFRSHPFRYAGLILVVVAGVGMAGWAAVTQPIAEWAILAGACAGAAGLALVVFLVWRVTKRAHRLTVTSRRVVMTKGLLSKHSVEMLHRTIQDIEISQSALDRVLKTGRVAIANASEDDDQIVMENVPNPYRVREVIDAYRPM